MYLRWLRNPVRKAGTRDDVLCFHEGPNRVSQSPQVIESYREPGGPVRKRLLWTPGGAIRTCCADDATDPVARVLWWLDVADRVNELRQDHTAAPSTTTRRLVTALPDLMGTLAQTVPLASRAESEFVECWVTGPARTQARARGETLRDWYARCWNEAQTLFQQRTASKALTLAEARALFGLPESFTPEALKKAYRKAAFAAHPDAGGTHERFIRVGEAYTLLCGL